MENTVKQNGADSSQAKKDPVGGFEPAGRNRCHDRTAIGQIRERVYVKRMDPGAERSGCSGVFFLRNVWNGKKDSR